LGGKNADIPEKMPIFGKTIIRKKLPILKKNYRSSGKMPNFGKTIIPEKLPIFKKKLPI